MISLATICKCSASHQLSVKAFTYPLMLITSGLAPEDSCSKWLFLAATHCSLDCEVALIKWGARRIQHDVEHQPGSEEQRHIMRSSLPLYRMGMDHPASLTMTNSMVKRKQGMLTDTVSNLVKSRKSCYKKFIYG